MSAHPFSQLQPDYAACLAHLSVTRPLDVDRAAKTVISNVSRYLSAVDGTHVPAAFVGVLDLREDDCRPDRALGQGDPWNQVSHNVPRGKGPFPSWISAAKFYIHYDHLDDNSQPWSLEYACWKGEIWNGLGPRAHGRRTGYLWSGTNLYDPPSGKGGKYTSDGRWSPGTVDQQLGIIPVLLRMFQLRPDLAFGSSLPQVAAPPLVPDVAPSPAAVGGGTLTTIRIQHMLNAVQSSDIAEDDSYGRRTRAAVRVFQANHGLRDDGLCGPATIEALQGAFLKTT